MNQLLASIPPDQFLEFVAAGCFLIAMFFTWLTKRILKLVEDNTEIKFTQAQHKQVDMVAQWATSSTQQVFSKAMQDAKKTADELNKEKLAHAVKVARNNLTPAVSARVTDEQLVQVIEAKISQSKAPPAMLVSPSGYPPSFVVPSHFPTNVVPSFTTTSVPPTTFVDVENIKT